VLLLEGLDLCFAFGNLCKPLYLMGSRFRVAGLPMLILRDDSVR
jgi:hypothetical protein